MSSFLSRIWTQQQLAYVPHTSVSGETWQFQRAGVTTAQGAAGGTTIIDSTHLPAVAENFSGYWILLTSGASKGEWKRVIDDSGAGTLTLEGNGFDVQVEASITYEIWKSPEPTCLVTTSTSTAAFSASARIGETNDYWKGYYLICIGSGAGSGPPVGELRPISAYVSATGAFTVSPVWSAQPAVGDLFTIRKFVEAGDINFGVSESYVPRPGNRIDFAMGDGITGPRAGSVSFKTQILPSGSVAAAEGDALLSPVGALFPAAGLGETIGKTVTVGAGSSTTAIKIATGDRENLHIGGMLVYQGNACFISSLDDGGAGVDTANVTPSLPSAPVAADVVYCARMYAKSTTGDLYGVTLEWEVDGVRTIATGCKGNVTLTDGEAPTLDWAFTLDHYTREIEAATYNANAAYTTTPPVLAKDRRVYLAGTATSVSGITATPGTTVTPKAIQGSSGVNGRSGLQITGYKAGATCRTLLNAATATLPSDADWHSRTAKDLIVVYGVGSQLVGLRIPVARLVAAPHPTNDGGLAATPLVYEAQDAGTALNNTTVTKVPDFAFCII